jgi:hypothetical protein
MTSPHSLPKPSQDTVMNDKRTTHTPIDWAKCPPFITSNSGGGSYDVTIKVHSIEELHAAHDLVLKAFSDASSDLLAKRWADANQG